MSYIPLLILLLSYLVSADTLVGCYSSVDGTEQGYYQYQTPSYCANECPDSPYVALKNGGTCYCLDSKPSSDLVSSSQCDVKCNGFGSEMCGGESTFSVYVGKGAASDDDDDDDNSDSSSSTEPSSTSTTSSSSDSSSTSESSSSTTEKEKSSITSAPSSSSTDNVELVTQSSSNSEGLVIIRTVTKDAEPTNSSSNDSKDDEKKPSTNTGAIAGGVVGGVVGLIAIGLLVFFLIKRRRNEEDDDEEEYFDKSGLGGSINRNYGTGKSKKSMKAGLDMPMTNPFTHPSDNTGATDNDLVDPRLNPVMLGRRRLSEGSLADETDYSRKILQVANPE